MNSEVGNLEINSEEIMSAVSVLDSSLNILQSDIKPMVLSNFDALKETGLFSEGLDKIAKQVESLCVSNENLMTKIAVHAEEFVALEGVLTTAASDYEGVYSPGNSGNSGNYYEVADIIVNTVNDGTSINTNDIIGSIPKLDETNQIKLVDFLKINKGDDISLSELLFDASKSGLLLVLLKKFYGDNNSSLDVKITDESLIAQRELLKMINNNDTLSSSLYSNSVLVAKEYLGSVAEANNISFEDLVIDDKYNNMFMSSVRDIYDGNINSNYKIDVDTVESVRKVVDNVAKSNNVAAEAVLIDSKYTPMLKGV